MHKQQVLRQVERQVLSSCIQAITVVLVTLTTVGVLSTAMAVLPMSGHAQEPSEIISIEGGSIAPFSGMLFRTETAVNWRQRIELLEERLELDVQRAEETGQLRLRLAEDTLRVRTEQYTDDRETLRESIVQAGETHWYDAPVLWLTLGVIVGAVVGAVITATAVKL